MKYKIITFGCQMNESDSERIASFLEKAGYKPTSKENEVDLILVNMCSVRQSAVDKVYGLTQKLKNLKTKKPQLKTILTGCILKGDKQKFKSRFDLILDIKDLPNWLEKLSSQKLPQKLLGEKAVANSGDRLNKRQTFFDIKPKYQTNFSSSVPISTGCNYFCSYCVVPYTRGREVSRPAKDIICEVKNLVKRGYKEIWLLGQNVNSYTSRINTNLATNNTNNISEIRAQISENSREINFAKLLKMVNDIPGNFWIRFTSPHPKNFFNELIETMAKCEKVTPYLNLPVQSGDNEILKKMNRNYTVEEYKKLVKEIRKTFAKIRGKFVPISVSTDVIVGFPGETKKQFENTVKLFKEIKFDMAYISKYSPRPGTTAFRMKDNVSPKEKERRYKVLTEVLKERALENNKKYIGKKVEVLIDESRIKNKELRILFGKTRRYKTVKILNSKFVIQNSNLVGQFVKVKIEKALHWGLKGRI